MDLDVAMARFSPLLLGEVGSPLAMRSIVQCDPGEGLRPIGRSHPLTPALSPWERGRTDHVALPFAQGWSE
jgi:hypothetical protein